VSFKLRTSRRTLSQVAQLDTRDRLKFEEIRLSIRSNPLQPEPVGRVRRRLVLGGFWQCVYATPSFPFAVLYTVDEDARVIEIIRLFPRLAAQRQVDTP
jgi:hypothetical protein